MGAVTFPSLPDPQPEGQIDSDEAYQLIVTHGVEATEAHPACEHIMLGNGDVLTLWYGGGWDDLPPYWTLESRGVEA